MALDLSNAPTAPPRSARAAQSAAQQTRRITSAKMQAREEAANGVFQLVSFGCVVTHQYADAGAISMHGPNIARAAAETAETSEPVAKALDYIQDAGPYAGLIVAVMPLVLQIMANHGVIKAELVAGGGVIPPAALESQVRADMAKQAAEALRAQEAAQEEMALLQQRLDAQKPAESEPEPNGAEPAGSRRAPRQAQS